VHTGAEAARSADDINAHAYTVGNDIVFGPGRFQPDTTEGRALLTHELTHVAQQSAHGEALVQREEKPQGINEIRENENFEQQRVETLQIISDYQDLIHGEAAKHHIPPEAIAGAILWEALENPYSRSVFRRGPGKIRSTPDNPLGGKSDAESAEDAGLIEKPDSDDASQRDQLRGERLMKPGWAIQYAAAIMRWHADNYLKIAGVDISGDASLLCTLFQTGGSEERAAKLAERIKEDPDAKPAANDQMGAWVNTNLGDISALLVKKDEFANDPILPTLTPTLSATAPKEKDVLVRKEPGGASVWYQTEIRRGGSPSWRSNNPGLLEKSAAVALGAYSDPVLTQKPHRIGVFATPEKGFQALKKFIRMHQRERTLRLIVEIIPLMFSTTEAAANALAQDLGLPTSTLVKSLSDDQLTQLAATLQRLQGWQEGTLSARPD
jgi:hypothetical protein